MVFAIALTRYGCLSFLPLEIGHTQNKYKKTPNDPEGGRCPCIGLKEGSGNNILNLRRARKGVHGTYLEQAAFLGIPNEVLHRVASMASGGMDTLPHNGAIITLLVVTGLSHREAYKDIFVLTILKTVGVFFVIGLYYLFGVV